MNQIVDTVQFSRAYSVAVDDVMRFVDRERQLVLARHNPGLHPDHTNLSAYLRASGTRYLNALGMLNKNGTRNENHNICDVGGFLAAFPLALARLGFPTTLVEEYDYYYGAFDALKDYLGASGVSILPLDFSQPLETTVGEFSFVTNMAMLEHMPASPKDLLENLKKITSAPGTLIVEVPNIAYWPRRLAALRGLSVHQPLQYLYRSEAPFMGHHREYTERELRQVLQWTGLDIQEIETFNYSIDTSDARLRYRAYRALSAPVQTFTTRRFKGCREILMACCTPAPTGHTRTNRNNRKVEFVENR